MGLFQRRLFRDGRCAVSVPLSLLESVLCLAGTVMRIMDVMGFMALMALSNDF